MSHPRLLRCLAFWLTVSPCFSSAGDHWPSFQNAGDVSVTDPTQPGEAFSVRSAWSASLPGTGQSSPVVWGDHVYVTSVSGDNKDNYHVTAVRLRDGAELWHNSLPNASPQENSDYVSKAAPTPVADSAGLICLFEGGNLVAYTHEGDVRWQRDLATEYGAIDARHGLGASLAQSGKLAFAWVERSTDPYVIAFDKATGETVWKATGAGAASWASPRLVSLRGGKQQLVLSGIGILIGLDPATGKRLWTFSKISGNSTPTPMPIGSGRFLIGATVGRGEASSGDAAASNGLVQIAVSEDGKSKVEYVWRADRATSSFGSPMAHEGHAYFVNASGVLYCLDLKTGRERYAARIGENIWATPIGLGESVWFFRKDGAVVVVASGPEFQKQAEFSAWPESETTDGPDSTGHNIVYAVARAGDLLLTRSGQAIHAHRIGGEQASAE